VFGRLEAGQSLMGPPIRSQATRSTIPVRAQIINARKPRVMKATAGMTAAKKNAL
jgi:hypothetical protein